MSTPGQMIEMAAYDEWQNEALYALCANLDEADRSVDRGMFFRSIHATLDHILLIDRVLMSTAAAARFSKPSFERQYDDFEELRAARVRFDVELRASMADCSQAWLEEDLRFFSATLQRERVLPRWLLFSQMFDHQTHHRSQVTTHLQLLGIDYGCTDIPFNPKSRFAS